MTNENLLSSTNYFVITQHNDIERVWISFAHAISFHHIQRTSIVMYKSRTHFGKNLKLSLYLCIMNLIQLFKVMLCVISEIMNDKRKLLLAL